LEPRKWRKVRTSPNSKFAGIEAIKRAQIKAGDHEIMPEASNDIISLASMLSFIEIED
jgi:hypothetical protein